MRKFTALTFLTILFISSVSFSQQLPIKPARTISFKTDEGSYMNIDVSPDGDTLVIDLLGDIVSRCTAEVTLQPPSVN
jgi:hypothetical protein